MSSLLLRQTLGSACPCCLATAPALERAPAARKRFVMPPSGRLRLERGTIVDPREGRLIPDATVVVDRGRIVAVEPAGATASDRSGERIDASGKFVVPGFNDMHTHVLELAGPAGALALMLCEGVTGFRQMSGSPRMLEERRSQTLPVGKLAPAALELPGSLLTPFNASSEGGVAAEIATQRAQGADFVKAGLMSGSVFRAALVAARKTGIPLLGHLQDGVDAAEASDLGFRSIEHLGPGSTIWIGCSTAEAELRHELVGLPRLRVPPFRIPFLEQLVMWRLQTLLINPAAFMSAEYVARMQRAFDTYDDAKCRALAARFAANGTWHVPTLVRLRTQELAGAPEYEKSPYLRHMSEKSIRQWRRVTKRFTALPPEARRTFASAYPRQLALARTLADAGVRMLTGCDGGTLSQPGLTLQEEFAELAAAGLSPLQVLRMTTLHPAEYLGRTATMGTVEPGRDADLVLLDANPLESVANLGRIAGVVRAGFHYARPELDALRERVAQGRGSLH